MGILSGVVILRFYKLPCSPSLYSPLDSPSPSVVVSSPSPNLPQTPVVLDSKIYGKMVLKVSTDSNISCNPAVLRLLFIVMSAPNPSSARIREMARNTIYRNLPKQVTVKFVLGTKDVGQQQLNALIKEQEKYSDLVLFDSHKDSYYELPRKLQLSLQWAIKNAQFDYIVKTDDDVIVRLDKLTDALSQTNCPSDLHWGWCYFGKGVSKKGKWGETKWFTCETYLPYCAGLAYIVGRRLVESVMQYGDYLRRFRLEDTTMGLWLVPYKRTIKHDKRFSLWPSCEKDTIVSHAYDYGRFQKTTKILMNTGHLC